MLEAVCVGLNQAQEEIEDTLDEIPHGNQEIKSLVEAYSHYYKSMSDALLKIV